MQTTIWRHLRETKNRRDVSPQKKELALGEFHIYMAFPLMAFPSLCGQLVLRQVWGMSWVFSLFFSWSVYLKVSHFCVELFKELLVSLIFFYCFLFPILFTSALIFIVSFLLLGFWVVLGLLAFSSVLNWKVKLLIWDLSSLLGIYSYKFLSKHCFHCIP